MFKVLLVIALLLGLFFLVQGFAEVATAPDLFDDSENESASVEEDVDE